jgi:heat shock protein HtpX
VSGPAPAAAAAGLAGTDFLSAQRRNRRLTVWLLALLTLIAAGLGAAVGAVLVLESGTAAETPDAAIAAALVGALALGLASLLWSAVALAFGDRLVTGMAGAREVSREDEPQLHNVVEEMAIAAGLPKPRVLVIDTEVPNAFATGMRPDRAAIGVTRGLLTMLGRAELQGVVGHEVAHIANLDTRYMTAVGVTVGLVALVGDLALRTLRWGRVGSARSGGDDRRKGGQAILVILLVAFAVLAPIAAKLVQFAVSRQREYLADATSVQLTRDPEGLISALEKLSRAAAPFPGASGATQHLFIVNPLRRFTARTPALLATHPALEERIARLRDLR